MSLKTELLMPYGIRKVDGKEVSVEEVPNGKACGCVCICCGEAVQSKQGKVRRWHFSHIPPGGAQCDRNLVIHASAILAIKRGIERAIKENASYQLRWECQSCGEVIPEELARSDTIVKKEASLIERTRSDLIILWKGGKRIIEVVFTHEPSQPTSERYQQSGTPVIIVRVKTVDDVKRLETGIDAHEGFNYPPTPCVECERQKAIADAEAATRRERERKAKAERDERAAVWAKWQESIREMDDKMRKAIQAFLQPLDSPMPVHKYWKERRKSYIRLRPRKKIHQEQKKLIRLGFSQHNDAKLWLMCKNFTTVKGEGVWVYVDYGYDRFVNSIDYDIYHFMDSADFAVRRSRKPSVWNCHADHFDYFLEVELRRQGLDMVEPRYDVMDRCYDCRDIKYWVESGQYEDDGFDHARGPRYERHINFQWIEAARRLLR